jgi:hypothetical protein
MIQSFFTLARCIDEDLELRACFALTNVFIELFWTKSSLKDSFGLSSPRADNTVTIIIGI